MRITIEQDELMTIILQEVKKRLEAVHGIDIVDDNCCFLVENVEGQSIGYNRVEFLIDC